jgi:hypothetical protein
VWLGCGMRPAGIAAGRSSWPAWPDTNCQLRRPGNVAEVDGGELNFPIPTDRIAGYQREESQQCFKAINDKRRLQNHYSMKTAGNLPGLRRLSPGPRASSATPAGGKLLDAKHMIGFRNPPRRKGDLARQSAGVGPAHSSRSARRLRASIARPQPSHRDGKPSASGQHHARRPLEKKVPLEYLVFSLQPVNQVPAAATSCAPPKHVRALRDPELQQQELPVPERSRTLGSLFFRLHGC